MQIFNAILTDCGSKYSVSGAPVKTKKLVVLVIKTLKKYAKASHNSWAAMLREDGPIKHDDGEAGAGMVILRMPERAELVDHVIVVTRWFGGTPLSGDRFRRIQDCVTHYLNHRRTT